MIFVYTSYTRSILIPSIIRALQYGHFFSLDLIASKQAWQTHLCLHGYIITFFSLVLQTLHFFFLSSSFLGFLELIELFKLDS